MRRHGGRSSTSIHFQSHSGSGSIVSQSRARRDGITRLTRGRDRDAGLLAIMWLLAISVSSRSRIFRVRNFLNALAIPRTIVPLRRSTRAPADVRGIEVCRNETSGLFGAEVRDLSISTLGSEYQYGLERLAYSALDPAINILGGLLSTRTPSEKMDSTNPVHMVGEIRVLPRAAGPPGERLNPARSGRDGRGRSHRR
jgi:hypothetical protein